MRNVFGEVAGLPARLATQDRPEGANGPIKVLGGAGTGKTVVAMHRAKYLLENVFINGERLLFHDLHEESLLRHS